MGSMLQIYVHIADAESEGGYLEVPLDVRTMESIDTIKSKLLEETDILDPGDFELTLDGLMLDSDLMVAETRIVDGTVLYVEFVGIESTNSSSGSSDSDLDSLPSVVLPMALGNLAW